MRTRVLGISADALDQGEAIRKIMDLATGFSPSLVCTANLDHAVRVRRRECSSNLYERAEMVLADGFPLVWASHLKGRRLPGRVTGADLIMPVCREAARRGLSVYFVGSTLDVLSESCRRLKSECPEITIAGAYAPSFGFHNRHPESRELVDAIRRARPHITFVGLGSPKQESWMDANRRALPSGVFVCIGAGFDYLAGRPRRAPRWVQQACLEWLWRLLHEPRRLARRYMTDLVYFPVLLLDQLRKQGGPGWRSGNTQARAYLWRGSQRARRETSARSRD
jgi:N-acetylglucosaminyldiphosphoundecaprenol N-acetyl-beta-D-mannosaminyltransferase